jgi:hypothetical protein
MTWPGLEPGPWRLEAAGNLSYNTAAGHRTLTTNTASRTQGAVDVSGCQAEIFP